MEFRQNVKFIIPNVKSSFSSSYYSSDDEIFSYDTDDIFQSPRDVAYSSDGFENMYCYIDFNDLFSKYLKYDNIINDGPIIKLLSKN